ncbi:MAG: ATP-binding protein, partial [Chloroflexota bacterium]
MAETYTFKAEIQQLLDILVHSLYTEREIFLRELVSNASDALNRIQFEMLTNRDVLDPEAPLEIRITTDEAAGTLTISDSGIGMNRDDLANNLGTIAKSGAKAFIEALKEKPDGTPIADVIGQFGVGFYSVFMVADKVRVISRSHDLNGSAYAWESNGGEEYTIEDAEREHRGTDIIIHLKEDAKEFLQDYT